MFCEPLRFPTRKQQGRVGALTDQETRQHRQRSSLASGTSPPGRAALVHPCGPAQRRQGSVWHPEKRCKIGERESSEKKKCDCRRLECESVLRFCAHTTTAFSASARTPQRRTSIAVALGLAPASSSTRTMSTEFVNAARCNGVTP
jgi:hypothetical protein